MVLKSDMLKAVMKNDVRALYAEATRQADDGPPPQNLHGRLVILIVLAVVVIGSIVGAFWWKERAFMKSLDAKKQKHERLRASPENIANASEPKWSSESDG